MRVNWSDNISVRILSHSDLLLAALVIGIIAMMIVPLPTWMLDGLLTLNIAMSVTLLMVSLYIPAALSISAFPSILLLTTLFRLALNVSSTRLILLQADAGAVISSFGEFVVQGNYIVGAVIFIILTLIQFLVIAKGAERVSEVAARFTLDAMPGKQMSIDADMRAGAFDVQQAREKRAVLQKESQLYGAMDGAMKFVKGDAIAAMVITVINIAAGIVVGVMQMDMSASDAAQIYTLLTIGDGLVSQIPALLIATTSGIIVTRVTSEIDDNHLGGDILGQLLIQPKALAIAATLIILLGIVPGLPFFPFFIVGGILASISGAILYNNRQHAQSDAMVQQKVVDDIKNEARRDAQQEKVLFPTVTPLTLEVGTELSQQLEQEHGQRIREMIVAVRESIFLDLGIKIPGVCVRWHSHQYECDEFAISLDEIPIDKGQLVRGKILVNENPDNLDVFQIHSQPAVHPITRQLLSWVDATNAVSLEEAGYKCWDDSEYIILRFTAAVQNHAYMFVGMQSIHNMLEQLEGPYPALVQEVVPKLLGLHELTEICIKLAEEKISLRNLPKILQILSDRAQTVKDPVRLTELVRSGLSRYITHKYASIDGSVVAYLVDQEIEHTIESAIRHNDDGHYLCLSPEAAREILDAVRSQLGSERRVGVSTVILTDQRVRRYMKRLISMEFSDVVVLAFQELDPVLTIHPLGRICLLGGPSVE